MANYRIQIANYKVGAVPTDHYINSLYGTGSAVITPAQWQTLLGSLTLAFANSGLLCHTNFDARVYNMSDPTPRPIIAQRIVAGTDVAGGPAQVALCLSYFSGRNLPRTRGRIYLGPLPATAVNVAVPAAAQLNATLILATAIDTAFTIAGLAWAIHSVKDNDFLPISDVWVDNSWDIQRRRKAAATTRLAQTV